jgi:hypothetical protein
MSPAASSSPSPSNPTQPHRGVLILVLGILGLVVCFPFGIAAWVMGGGDLREMRAGRMDPTGQGMTQAGYIIGIIATLLALLAFLIALILAMFGILASIFG